MNDREEPGKTADAETEADDRASKGQYGGLKGLGPGGGRDIKDATKTEDIGADSDKNPRR